MSDKKLITGRPTLTINEAMELGKCNVADLFHKAETGELTIYVMADGWIAKSIDGIDHSIDTSNHKFPGKIPMSYRGPYVPIPPPTAPNEKDYETHVRQLEYFDIVIGDRVSYVRHGLLGMFYRGAYVDRVPIAPCTFTEYRRSPEKAEITLNLNKMHNLPDDPLELFFHPDPVVLLEDMIQKNRLVVLAADFNKLLGRFSDETLSELYEHPYWPTELGIAIAAWQHARDEYKEGQKPKAIIEEWLSERYTGDKSLKKGAINRISTIANWEKIPGPAKS